MRENIIRQSILLMIVLFVLPTLAFSAENSELPGRKTYPYVKYIDLKNFYWKFEAVTIVDVRSRYEFQTLRIKGAINIPLASRNFIKAMRILRKETHRPIIVYCNGKTCLKSYQAVTKCISANIKNIIDFDAGILDWEKTYP